MPNRPTHDRVTSDHHAEPDPEENGELLDYCSGPGDPRHRRFAFATFEMQNGRMVVVLRISHFET